MFTHPCPGKPLHEFSRASLVVVCHEHVCKQRLAEAARANDEREPATAMLKYLNKWSFIDVRIAGFSEIVNFQKSGNSTP